jgi:phosphate/sulfate permease
MERDTEENLLANTLNSLYNKNNRGFNTTAASEGFVCGSESLTYKSTNNEQGMY